MSDKTELNPDLKKLEAALGRLAIPPVSLDRDELMYRSGWEAALANSRDSFQFSLLGEQAGRQWLLPAISVLSSAAAILFGIMLLNQTSNPGGVELAVASNVAPSGMVIAEPESTEQAEDVNVLVAAAPDLLQRVMDLRGSKTLYAGMVVGPNFPTDFETGLKSPVSPSSGDLNPPLTQQELLNELLPNRVDRSPRWSLFRLGGNS